MIDGPEALGALPGDVDFVVTFVGGDRLGEPVLLPVGQVLGAGAENVADPVERIIFAAAVAVNVLLDAAAGACQDFCVSGLSYFVRFIGVG